MFTVWLKIAKHKKDPNTLPLIKKFFGFCFETAYNESPEDELVMLFDMTNTGISNLVITCIMHDNDLYKSMFTLLNKSNAFSLFIHFLCS